MVTSDNIALLIHAQAAVGVTIEGKTNIQSLLHNKLLQTLNMRRAGIIVDVQTIFHKMEQRNLVAAYKFYCGKDLEGAHSADADTRATYEVLKAQLDKYPSLQNEVEYLSAFSTQNKNVDLAGRFVFDDKGVEVFNFGKYKGMSVAEVLAKDTGYYGWMMKGDFPQDTKNVLTKIYFKVHSSK